MGFSGTWICGVVVSAIPDSKGQDSAFHKQTFSRFRNIFHLHGAMQIGLTFKHDRHKTIWRPPSFISFLSSVRLSAKRKRTCKNDLLEGKLRQFICSRSSLVCFKRKGA